MPTTTPVAARCSPMPALLLLSDALDHEGRPRIALALPTQPNGYRPPMLLFPDMPSALAAKRQAEAAMAGSVPR